MKSKVKSATFKKEGTSTYGTYYVHQIVLENGMQGQYLSKTREQNTFVAGQEAEFDVEKKTYNGNEYNTFKPIRAAGAGFKVNPVYENKRVALKCAVDLVAAKIITENQLKKYAENFLQFLSE